MLYVIARIVKKCVCTTNITLILWRTIMGGSANMVSNDYIDAILQQPPPPETYPPTPKQAKSRQSNFRAAKFKTCHFDN